MKKLKIGLISVGVFVVLMVGFYVAYCIRNAQGVIEPAEYNKTSKSKTTVLIGSQGTDFKNALVQKLVQKITAKDIYIKVIDVTSLPAVNEESWDAIILINTIEWYKLQKNVIAFIDSAKVPDKIVMLATSGRGNMKPKKSRIDTITSASEIDKVNERAKEILTKLEQILGLEF